MPSAATLDLESTRDEIPAEIRRELSRARADGHVHGAYLLDGPPGTGRRATALWLARLLFCRGDGPDPCERCPDCRKSRLAPEDAEDAAGTDWPQHPDFHHVEPGDTGRIRIDQIRELQRRLSLVANEGGRRVALISGAEALGVSGANALLKLLEEPPDDTTLLLVTRAAEALPITIRSRCTRLRFAPASEDALTRALVAERGLSPDDAALAAQLAGGSVASAAAFADRTLTEAAELRDRMLSAVAGGDGDILDLAESFRGGGRAGRGRVELFFDVYDVVTRAALREAIAEPGAPGEPAVERAIARADAGRAARLELERRNLNPQLVVESLLFGLRD